MSETNVIINSAKFSIGDLIHHKLFNYRGVIIDIDATFQLTEEWYQSVAKSRPAKDLPWYHVLVHDSDHITYVAEQNIEADISGEKISNPVTEQFFSTFKNGHYVINEKVN